MLVFLLLWLHWVLLGVPLHRCCEFCVRRSLASLPLRTVVQVAAIAVDSEPSGFLSACVLQCLRACAWKCESVFWLCNSRLHRAIWHTHPTQEFKRHTDRHTLAHIHSFFLFFLPFGRVHFLMLFPSSCCPVLVIVTGIICKCTPVHINTHTVVVWTAFVSL